MSLQRFMVDDIQIENEQGNITENCKASVQGDKIIIIGEQIDIEEGGKIRRTLPNGKQELYSILKVDFLRDPNKGARLSHYTVHVQKETSRIPQSKTNEINIYNSHGIQIGDGNVQQFITTFESILKAIDKQEAPNKDKKEAKKLLKRFLSHPLTLKVIGPVAEKVLERI